MEELSLPGQFKILVVEEGARVKRIVKDALMAEVNSVEIKSEIPETQKVFDLVQGGSFNIAIIDITNMLFQDQVELEQCARFCAKKTVIVTLELRCGRRHFKVIKRSRDNGSCGMPEPWLPNWLRHNLAAATKS